MKRNGTLSNIAENLSNAEIGDDHVGTSKDTPMKPDAFKLSDEEKMDQIEFHFKAIMETLGLDLNDDSLKGTPKRVAKMYVKEIFNGLNPDNKPKVALFENVYGYNNMLVEKNIAVRSFCEHHFVPIKGYAHVAYISSGNVIGLSKINRIVDYFSRRPQVQERLTEQIANELKTLLKTEHIAVMIHAKHMCVSMRGIKDGDSETITSTYSGKFKTEQSVQDAFLRQIKTDNIEI